MKTSPVKTIFKSWICICFLSFVVSPGVLAQTDDDQQTIPNLIQRLGDYGKQVEYNGVYKVVFSPDGKKIATRNQDQSVRVFSLESGEIEHTFSKQEFRISDVVFHPTENQLVTVADQDENPVIFWNLKTGMMSRAVDENAKMVRFKKDSTKEKTRLEFADDQQQVRVDLAEGSMTGNLRKWSSNRSGLLLGMSQDGNHIAFLNRLNGKTGHFQITTWTPRAIQVATGFKDQPVMVDFSWNPKILAACCKRDSKAYLWNLEKSTKAIQLVSHSGPVQQVAFSNDGRFVATASWDSTIKIWDSRSGVLLNTLSGHSERVVSVAFAKDDSRIASGASGRTDCSVCIWDFRKALFEGREVSKLDGMDELKKNIELLGSKDAALALDAAKRLSLSGEPALKMIRETLDLEQFPDTTAIKKLIQKLGAEKFSEREAAQKKLIGLRETAQGIMREVLASETSPEIRFRLKEILSIKSDVSTVSVQEELQMNRIVFMLELSESKSANEILKVISLAYPSAKIQSLAKIGLKRSKVSAD